MFFPERIKHIKKNDRVLEIGPGSSPFPRSNVFLEKRFKPKEAFEQRALQRKIEHHKPLYYYDGLKFPFKDQEFDYVVCAQVLEHVPPNELASFICEMERVAKRGYIEIPRLFYEYLFNFRVHKWLINYKNRRLLLLDKNKVTFTPIQDIFHAMLNYAFKNKKLTFFRDFADFFMIGFEWEQKINYQIVDSLNYLISNRDIVFYQKYFIRISKQNTRGNRSRFFVGKIYKYIKSFIIN